LVYDFRSFSLRLIAFGSEVRQNILAQGIKILTVAADFLMARKSREAGKRKEQGISFYGMPSSDVLPPAGSHLPLDIIV
jgi:hypothetical protein